LAGASAVIETETRPERSVWAMICERLDVDSMDLLNFLIGVHEALQVDIPEADYPKVSGLTSLVAYLKAAADR
jgi:hypothetical protein